MTLRSLFIYSSDRFSKSFLDHVLRISSPEYLPSEADLLRSCRPTRSIRTTTMEWRNFLYVTRILIWCCILINSRNGITAWTLLKSTRLHLDQNGWSASKRLKNSCMWLISATTTNASQRRGYVRWDISWLVIITPYLYTLVWLGGVSQSLQICRAFSASHWFHSCHDPACEIWKEAQKGATPPE